MREMAMMCLYCASIARHLAQTTVAADSDYWNASAENWLRLAVRWLDAES